MRASSTVVTGIQTRQNIKALQGVCHEIFEPHFFHDSNPPSRPWDKQAKFGFNFFEIFECLKSSVVCIILQSQAPPSSQSSSAVCITLQSQVIKSSQQTQRCATVHLTVETESAKGCTPRSQNRNLCESLAAFKGTIGEILPEGEQIYHEEKI